MSQGHLTISQGDVLAGHVAIPKDTENSVTREEKRVFDGSAEISVYISGSFQLFEAQFYPVPPCATPSLSAYQSDASFVSGMKTLCEDLQGCGKTRLTSQQTVHSLLVSVALVASWAARCSECKDLWGHTNTFRVWHPQLPTLGVLPGDLAHCVFSPPLLDVLSHAAC